MDTSKTYARMCEKATEIQVISEQQQFDSHGNYYSDSATNQPTTFLCCDCGTFIGRKESKRYIWLPRQDQLQEMTGEDWVSIFEKMGWFANDNCADEWSFDNKAGYGSMEQLWLAFVMKERFNEVWDGEDWITGEDS